MAATALMAASDHPAQPKSLILMAGPVDTRVNPTKVNQLAHSKPLSWFERNVICTVPMRYRGALRRVYPGFLQVSGFAGMNLDRHVRQHAELYNSLVRGERDKAVEIEDFYDEYLAVLDMPAEILPPRRSTECFNTNCSLRGTWCGEDIRWSRVQFDGRLF